MRISLCILASLLLAPGIALAQNDNTSGNGGYGAGQPAAPQSTTASAPAALPSGQIPADEEKKAICRARRKAYLKSLKCFEPYRHGRFLDVEAYKHCKVLKEPTDCPPEGLK